MFLGLGIVEGGGNNQPIEGRTKTMPLVTTSMMNTQPDHFDELCKHMYYVYSLFLPFLLFHSFDNIFFKFKSNLGIGN